MASNANFSILADVELNLKNIQQQLNKHKITFNIDGQSIKVAGMGLDELTKGAKSASDATNQAALATTQAAYSADEMALSYQAANKILQETIQIITAMVEQVYALDSSMTEFKKVTDLNDQSLEDYKNRLAEMGGQVARTGKPKRLALSDGMVNQH